MVQSLLDLLRTLTTPERLIALLSSALGGWLGYTFLFAVVFAETGLLVGFFLPGDSLLFTVGVVAGAGNLNIVLVNALLMLAAVAGDTVGYFLGRSAGPHIFNRPSSRFFNREHLIRTHEFYEKYGGKTIVYARFVPIIRTFAPFVAGVGEMNYLRFVSYNLFGGIGWVFLMTMLGYTLGNVPFVRHYFDKVILAIIAISLLPAVREFLKVRRPREDAAVPRR
ncbi:MAG TPA: VTT domain-containing protein [Bryobacteraceae bacterium]|nr:VTT domain-containing protein [Bryobacteraceae bacterium]